MEYSCLVLFLGRIPLSTKAIPFIGEILQVKITTAGSVAY
jgi:hypothetical protein